MPSSTGLGSRSSCWQMRSYSAWVRPTWAGVSRLAVANDARLLFLSPSFYRFEDESPVYPAEHGFGATFRMRHETEDVALGVLDTGDGANGSVRIGGRAQLAGGI